MPATALQGNQISNIYTVCSLMVVLHLIQVNVLTHIRSQIPFYARIFGHLLKPNLAQQEQQPSLQLVRDKKVYVVIHDLVGCIRKQEPECSPDAEKGSMRTVETRLRFLIDFVEKLYLACCQFGKDLSAEFWHAVCTSIVNGVTMIDELARVKAEEEALKKKNASRGTVNEAKLAETARQVQNNIPQLLAFSNIFAFSVTLATLHNSNCRSKLPFDLLRDAFSLLGYANGAVESLIAGKTFHELTEPLVLSMLRLELLWR